MQLKAMLVGTVAAVAVAGTLAACGSNGTASTSSTPTAPMSTSASASRTGTFQGLNGKHVAGTATLKGSTLTLTGYSSDQGPDLHIYLTNGTSESDVSAGVEISTVAYNQMSQTFTLPGSANGSMYKDVVIHCDKAKAVFGAATLM